MPGSSPGMTIRVGDVLRTASCPLVEVAADEPLPSIARLMTFAGLTAVLQIAPCGRPVRLMTECCVLRRLAAGADNSAEPAVLRCEPMDLLSDVADAILHGHVQAESMRNRVASTPPPGCWNFGDCRLPCPGTTSRRSSAASHRGSAFEFAAGDARLSGSIASAASWRSAC